MAFTFNNYATSELGKSPLNDLVGSILSGYEQSVKASYLQPTIAEQLKKAQLENKWYEPNMQSEIGLRGAHAGLLGEQTKGARLENQFLPEYKRAQIQQLQAQAEKSKLLQMIREQLLGGGGNMGAPAQQATMPMFQGQGMPSTAEQMQPSQQPSNQNPGGISNYAQAAIASQALGLSPPKIVEANGKYLAITPFGTIDTGAHGLGAKEKQLAIEDAKKIADLEERVINSSDMYDNLGSLNSILGSHEFEVLRQNPILGKHELAWYKKFGTKEQQDLVGQAQTFMGNIIKASARDFPGQFRVGEQALLNDMKPNESDSLDVMKGKAAALTYLNTIMTKRAELEADYMRNYSMSPLQARIAADKNINPKEIKGKIHTILHPASSTKYEITADEALAELKRRQAAGIR